MTYEVPEDAVQAERLRHRHLAQTVDPETRRLLQELGIGEGLRCLEAGMGGGSVAAWMAECVGASGEVLATDVDLRLKDEFLAAPPPQLEVRKHDILADPLPQKHFDLVHARALLEHLEDPGRGLANLAAATRPGGWLLVEGSHWALFDMQTLPEPFGEFMRALRALEQRGVHDHRRDYSARFLAELRAQGMVRTGCRGHFWTMQGGTPSLEWFILALEWAVPGLADSGALDLELAREAIAQARQEDFVIMSPTHVAAWGQVPPA